MAKDFDSFIKISITNPLQPVYVVARSKLALASECCNFQSVYVKFIEKKKTLFAVLSIHLLNYKFIKLYLIFKNFKKGSLLKYLQFLLLHLVNVLVNFEVNVI